MLVFHGAPLQRGYGLGSFFASLARRALPFFKQGAKAIGRAALRTGANVAQDVLAGKNLKESTRSRIRQSAQTLKEQALNQLMGQRGSGRTTLKRKKPKRSLSSTQTTGVKTLKTAPQKKRKSHQSQGKVKKSKVAHLQKYIFD